MILHASIFVANFFDLLVLHTVLLHFSGNKQKRIMTSTQALDSEALAPLSYSSGVSHCLFLHWYADDMIGKPNQTSIALEWSARNRSHFNQLSTEQETGHSCVSFHHVHPM